MQINLKNLCWALQHPVKTLRYCKYRDVIPYADIARYLPAAPVILEAGAANGDNTVEIANYWPNATIHAFEPVPNTKAILDQKVAGFAPRVSTYPYALGDQPGTFELHVSGAGDANSTQSSSLLEPTGHHDEFSFVKFSNKIDVEVMRMDDWASAHQIPKVDFLWLDMQGYELRALTGATELLKTVSALQIEVQFKELYAGAPLYPEVKQWMAKQGFKPQIEAVFRVSGNVLFVR